MCQGLLRVRRGPIICERHELMSKVEHVLTARARLAECPGLGSRAREARRGWTSTIIAFISSTRRAGAIATSRPARSCGRDRARRTATGCCVGAARSAGAARASTTGSVEPLLPRRVSAIPTRASTTASAMRAAASGSAPSASSRGEAALYRYDPDGSLHVMETGLTISNGLGWSPDGRTFYLTDSPQRKIYAYRFDLETRDHRRSARARRSRRRGGRARRAGDRSGGPPVVGPVERLGHRLLRRRRQGARAHRACRCSARRASPSAARRSTDLYVTSASVGLSQTEVQAGICAGRPVSHLDRGLRGCRRIASAPPASDGVTSAFRLAAPHRAFAGRDDVLVNATAAPLLDQLAVHAELLANRSSRSSSHAVSE